MNTVFKNEINEEIELNQFEETRKICVRLTVEKYIDTGDIDITFKSSIDAQTGGITISPIDPNVSILSAALASNNEEDHEEVNNDGTITVFYSLDVHMISEDETSGFEITDPVVDVIGQAIILPAKETTQFISATHSDSTDINLITEGTEETNIEASEEETSESQPADEKEEGTEEDPKQEVPEVKAEVINESLEVVEPPVTEGDAPYDREQIESILTEITDNFSTPNGVVKCGYDEERALAEEILRANDYYLDIVPNGDWHIISYAKMKEHDKEEQEIVAAVADGDISAEEGLEAIKESQEGTASDNIELTSLVLEDLSNLLREASVKAEKLGEYYDILNLDAITVDSFRSSINNLIENSFDEVSIAGLKDILQKGSM